MEKKPHDLPDDAAPARPLRARVADHRVQWRWVISIGTVVPLLSAMLTLSVNVGCAAIVFSLPDLSKEEISRIIDLCVVISAWGVLLVVALLTACAAAWVARRMGRDPIAHGVLIGLVSMLITLILGSISEVRSIVPGTVQGAWNLAVIILTLSAGWLGGIEARAALSRQEALYRVGRAIAAAGNPQAIVDAIGEHLAGSRVNQVVLGQVTAGLQDEAPIEIHFLASWISREAPTLPPEFHLDSRQVLSLTRLQQRVPVQVGFSSVSRAERAVWQELGIRSALLLPLTNAQDALIGVLVIASKAARGFKRSIWHTQILSPQVALALENMRLLEQARQAAVLEERQRLAREIHDTLAQGFTSIVTHLEAAELSLPSETSTVQRHLDQARQTAREGLVEARRLVWALRPEILEQDSLPAAVERIVARWAQESGIAVDTATTGTTHPLPPEVEVMLLRATQEALANVRKHARASQVSVTLSYMDDMVVLDVQDNGLGFDPAKDPMSPADHIESGYGLTAMRERIEQLGGTLLVESAPSEGTTLVVEILIPAGEQKSRLTHKERRDR